MTEGERELEPVSREDEDDGEAGGETACALHRVCDACGALEDGPVRPVCVRCGAARSG